MRTTHHQRGFTLVELVMVIVLMGVIGGMVAVFMKSPIDAYFDSARRAALTDVADTTVRRMARDIRKALPNSIRLPTGNTCMEFIPTRTGGRYRAEGAGALDFAGKTTIASFNMLGSNTSFAGADLPVDQKIDRRDVIVVYNLGIPGSDAYELSNTAAVSAAPVTPTGSSSETPIRITYSPGLTHFPLASASNRFHVVPAHEQVVSYVFVAGAASAAGDAMGTLYRYARPALSAAYPLPADCVALESAMWADTAHPPAVLANNVSTGSFAYDASSQRNAILQMTLGLTRSNETVSLYHEVHVDNTP